MTQRVGFVVLACLAVLVLQGCPATTGDVYSLAEWREVLKANGNWHMLKLPDNKIAPGSIVKITEQDGLSWIDALDSCGVPAALLVAKPRDSQPPTLVLQGESPSIKFTKKVEYSADALLNISGVKVGPEFSKIGKVVLTMGENGGDALRVIALQNWIGDNQASYKKICDDVLGDKDHYLVTESYRISSATYTLYDKTGGKLKLDLGQIGKILQFEPNAGVSVAGEGELKIDKPMYVAVRRARRTEGGFSTLSKPAAGPTGDDLLEKHNIRLAK